MDPTASPNAPTQPIAPALTAERTLRTMPLMLAASGLLGAAVALVVLAEFRPGWVYIHEGMAPANEAQQAQARLYDLLNQVSAFAVVGVIVAVCCAFGEALSRRSWKAAAVGVPASVVLGAAAGALGGWCGHRIDHVPLPLIDTGKTILRHSIVWGCMGLGVGCGVALPLGRLTALAKAIVAAALGGIASAFAYVSVVSFFFPNLSTDALVPTEPLSRAILFCLNGLLMGGFLGLVLAPSQRVSFSRHRSATAVAK